MQYPQKPKVIFKRLPLLIQHMLSQNRNTCKQFVSWLYRISSETAVNIRSTEHKPNSRPLVKRITRNKYTIFSRLYRRVHQNDTSSAFSTPTASFNIIAWSCDGIKGRSGRISWNSTCKNRRMQRRCSRGQRGRCSAVGGLHTWCSTRRTSPFAIFGQVNPGRHSRRGQPDHLGSLSTIESSRWPRRPRETYQRIANLGEIIGSKNCGKLLFRFDFFVI